MNQTTPNTRTEQTILVGRGKAALQLPVWFQGGSAVHPMLAITSMVHGDEYEALAAVLEFWKSIERRKLNGSVLILPVCNPLAAEAATRSTPERFDGKNLARVFPGSARGTITPQIARRIWEITEEADVLVDLHSGGTGYNYAPLAGYYHSRDKELARCFPIQYLWKVPANPGVLSYEWSRKGKRVIGFEYGGEARLDPDGTKAYVQGLWRLMDHLGICKSTISKSKQIKQIELKATAYQFTDKPGWLFPSVTIGRTVRRGQPIGEWVDEHLKRSILKSQFTGKVIGLRTLPRVAKGDYLTVIGR